MCEKNRFYGKTTYDNQKNGNWIKWMGWTPTKTGSESTKILILLKMRKNDNCHIPRKMNGKFSSFSSLGSPQLLYFFPNPEVIDMNTGKPQNRKKVIQHCFRRKTIFAICLGIQIWAKSYSTSIILSGTFKVSNSLLVVIKGWISTELEASTMVCVGKSSLSPRIYFSCRDSGQGPRMVK